MNEKEQTLTKEYESTKHFNEFETKGNVERLVAIVFFFLTEYRKCSWTTEELKIRFQELLKFGVNLRNDEGRTFLHFSEFIKRHPDLATSFILAGGDINAKMKNNDTPLMSNIHYDDVAYFLLSNNASLDGVNVEGNTLLHSIAHKCTTIRPLLFRLKGKFSLTEMLRKNPDPINSRGETPVMLCDSLEVLQWLVDEVGCSCSQVDFAGNNALHHQCIRGRKNEIVAFLSRIVNPHLRNRASITPIMLLKTRLLKLHESLDVLQNRDSRGSSDFKPRVTEKVGERSFTRERPDQGERRSEIDSRIRKISDQVADLKAMISVFDDLDQDKMISGDIIPGILESEPVEIFMFVWKFEFEIEDCFRWVFDKPFVDNTENRGLLYLHLSNEFSKQLKQLCIVVDIERGSMIAKVLRVWPRGASGGAPRGGFLRLPRGRPTVPPIPGVWGDRALELMGQGMQMMNAVDIAVYSAVIVGFFKCLIGILESFSNRRSRRDKKEQKDIMTLIVQLRARLKDMEESAQLPQSERKEDQKQQNEQEQNELRATLNNAERVYATLTAPQPWSTWCTEFVQDAVEPGFQTLLLIAGTYGLLWAYTSLRLRPPLVRGDTQTPSPIFGITPNKAPN